MKLDFDQIYWSTVLAMKINRSHPSIARDKKWALQFLAMHGTFTVTFILLVYCIVNHDLKNNDFSSTCRNGCLCVVYIVITFSYCTMIFNQELLKRLIDTMKKDYAEAVNLPIEEQGVIFEYANNGMYVCWQWRIISIGGITLFPLKNIVLYAYYYYIDDFQLVPIYEMTLPRIIEEYRENIFVYILIYLITLYYGLYAAVMYTAFVPLGPVFMVHICGQLELIKRRAEDLFVKHERDEAEDKLKDIIRQLQYVYSFLEDTKACFKIVYELTLKATTIILPIACYEVIEAFERKEIRLEFVTFIIGGTLISSSPCYYSNLLMEKGEQVRLAVYRSGWEVAASRTSRSTLLVILQRALQPIAIRTMFRTLCLDALTNLFQQSYAIFNLMNAMWK